MSVNPFGKELQGAMVGGVGAGPQYMHVHMHACLGRVGGSKYRGVVRV